jgi:chloramphenicol-sensitive protein RarD
MLAGTFGGYGLIRKKIPLEPFSVSTMESLLLVFPALGLLWYCTQQASATGAPPMTHFEWMLLVLGGVVTALPLVWFVNAVKRLPLSTVGFFQYITPTLHFLLAVFLYNEVFTDIHAKSFACIWLGLGVYTIDVLITQNRLAQRKKAVVA